MITFLTEEYFHTEALYIYIYVHALYTYIYIDIYINK